MAARCLSFRSVHFVCAIAHSLIDGLLLRAKTGANAPRPVGCPDAEAFDLISLGGEVSVADRRSAVQGVRKVGQVESRVDVACHAEDDSAVESHGEPVDVGEVAWCRSIEQGEKFSTCEFERVERWTDRCCDGRKARRRPTSSTPSRAM